MGLIKKVYDRLGEISDEGHPNFNGGIHYWLRKSAYFCSLNDGNTRTQIEYWNAAKAYFTVMLLGKGFNLFRHKDIDEEDRRILATAKQLEEKSDIDNIAPKEMWFNIAVHEIGIRPWEFVEGRVNDVSRVFLKEKRR